MPDRRVESRDPKREPDASMDWGPGDSIDRQPRPIDGGKLGLMSEAIQANAWDRRSRSQASRSEIVLQMSSILLIDLVLFSRIPPERFVCLC